MRLQNTDVSSVSSSTSSCNAAGDLYWVSDNPPTVPVQPETGYFSYMYTCPEGTFVTRFFGRADTVVNTLTAQCSRSWNLRTVGNPAQSPGVPSYSHTSPRGYSGIMAKSYTGSLDCLAFVNSTGGVSPPIGNAALPGPSIPLTCNDESLIVGIYGWQDAYVSSIGIICSGGGCCCFVIAQWGPCAWPVLCD